MIHWPDRNHLLLLGFLKLFVSNLKKNTLKAHFLHDIRWFQVISNSTNRSNFEYFISILNIIFFIILLIMPNRILVLLTASRTFFTFIRIMTMTSHRCSNHWNKLIVLISWISHPLISSLISVRQTTPGRAVGMSSLPMTILITNGLAIVYMVLIYSSSFGFHHFLEGSQKYTLVDSKCKYVPFKLKHFEEENYYLPFL